MLEVLVRPWLLRVSYGNNVITINGYGIQCTWNHTYSVVNSFIHTISCATSAAAIYTASIVDAATTLYLELLQQTVAPFKTNT
jgi:hypothetical protein